MRICKNCNSMFENDYPRCAMCGGETEPVIIAQPDNNQNIPNDANIPIGIPRSARIMSYIGLGMAIFGLACGAIFLLCSFASFADPAFGAIFLVYSIFTLGGSIAGLNLTSKAMYEGLYSSACTAGKTLSIIGLVINIVACAISFMGLFS